MMTTLTLNDLKILSSVTPTHKYGLEILAAVNGSGTHLALGGLYHALNRLEREGLVESYWGEATSARGGHRRRYYRITAQGALAATEQQTALATFWNWPLAYSF